MIVTEREREAETQAEGEAGSMRREPDVGFDPGSPGSRPGPKAGAKPLRHPGIPLLPFCRLSLSFVDCLFCCVSYLDEVTIFHFCFCFFCLYGCTLHKLAVAKFKPGVACVLL